MTAPADYDAFVKIQEQHRALKDRLGRIGRMLAERSCTIAEVGYQLGQLGDQLVKHFALEETGGYFGEALLHAPRLVRRANDLLAQHPKMAAHAEALRESTAETDADDERWWDETRERFAAFVDELLEHEQNENRLLLDAYGRDIEAGD